MKKLIWLMAFLVIISSFILPNISVGADNPTTLISYKDEWLGSYETVLFNTYDGDLGIGQYALAENGAGYYTRTKPKNESQFELVNLKYDVSKLTQVKIIDGCAYYNEFLTTKGASYRYDSKSTFYMADVRNLPDGSIIRVQSNVTEYFTISKVAESPQPNRNELVDTLPPSKPLPEEPTHHSIAYDNVSSYYSDSASSISWSHTTTGTNRLLVVTGGNSDYPTKKTPKTISYNSVNLSKARSDYYVADQDSSFIFYLIAPDEGTYTITITMTGLTSYLSGGGMSYTGAKQTSQPDAVAGTNGSSASPKTVSVAIDTVANNSWVVSNAFVLASTSLTANNTSRWQINEANYRRGGSDTNAGKTPAGLTSMSWSLVGTGTLYYAVSVASFSEYVAPPDVYLTTSSGSGGNVTTPGEGTYNYSPSTVVNISATADACYHFVNWTGNTTDIGNVNAISTNISMGSSNKTATANFAINTSTITYVNGSGGGITGSLSQTINCGTYTTAVTAVPNACYTFLNWSDANVSVTRTDLGTSTNQSFTANFAINTSTITYSANAGGSIVGSTPQTVNCGAYSTAVTATPNACYRFITWDDANVSATRTDLGTSTNQTYTATFAINTSTITYTAGANGTLNNSVPQTVNCGSYSTYVLATGNYCYQFKNWSDASTTNPRRDLGTSTNQSYTANFELSTYTLTYSAGAGGSINGTSPQTINCSANGSAVLAEANACYYFLNWSDGSTANPRTDLNISANLNVTANFAITTYTLNVSSGANGNVTTPTEGIHTYNCGQVVNLVATPDLHFWFENWTGNVTTIANVNDSTTTITINGNYSIVANFIPSTDLFPPTNISVTQTSSMCINISWDMGVNSVGTLIVICEDIEPTDCTVPDLGNLSDGCYVLYNGSDTSASYCGIDTTLHEYYITFWGTDGAGHYSVTCENETLGGANMTGVMLLGILLFAGIAFLVVSFWQRQWWLFMTTGLLWFIIMAFIFTQYSSTDMEYWIGYVALLMAIVCGGCVFWFREKHETINPDTVPTREEELADTRDKRSKKIRGLRNMRNNTRGGD